MGMLEKAKEKLGIFGEWASIMAPVFALFLWVHHENIILTNRLDQTNTRLDQTNVRIDKHFIEINKRSDQLHQEFIDLLKERGK